MAEVREDEMAARLRGFGAAGVLAILVILAGNLVVIPLSAVLVLVWARLSKTPWRSLGFLAPKSWVGTIAAGVLLGIVFKLGMKAVVMPLLGASPINARYQYLTGNPAALPWMLYAVVVGAGFGEETLFRGFFFERLEKLIGRGKAALAATVLLTSALFGAAHYWDQGVPGVQQAAVMGLVFGTLFAVTKRIWLPMVTHAAFDLTAVALIYWNWETAVAQMFFR